MKKKNECFELCYSMQYKANSIYSVSSCVHKIVQSPPPSVAYVESVFPLLGYESESSPQVIYNTRHS